MSKKKKKSGSKKKSKAKKKSQQLPQKKKRDSFVIKPLESLLDCENCIPNIETSMVQSIMNLCDGDNDGKINGADLYFFFRKFSHDFQSYPDHYDCRNMVKKIDRSQLDRISFHDFRRFLKRRVENGNVVKDLGSVFDIFDRNGDQTVTAEEIFPTLKDLGEDVEEIAHIRQWIAGWDLDGDGKLDRSEFEQIIFEGLDLDDQ